MHTGTRTQARVHPRAQTNVHTESDRAGSGEKALSQHAVVVVQ